MRAIDLLKFLFEIITLIILIILVVIFIETIIQASYGEDLMYKQYAYEIAQIINGSEQQLYIPSYDLQYVPVLVITNGGDAYLFMYKCNYNLQSIPQLPLWNVSEIGNVYLFAPDLSQCTLLTEDYIGTINGNINIFISSLGGTAGYVALTSSNSNSQYLVPTGITIYNLYSNYNYLSPTVYIYSQTNITCSSSGCYINGNPLECYFSYGENYIKSCAELFGLLIENSNSFNVNPYSINYLEEQSAEINGGQYNYMSLVLSQFINNPILLIENENGNIIFYYLFNVTG